MRGRIVAGALCALVVLVGGAAAETAASAQGVVISEFRTRGPLGGNDEFIELYNATGADVDIGGWLVRGSNNAGTVSTRATIPSPTTLAAGCHYLLTNATPTTGYSGSVAGDRTFTTGITDDGGIALTLADTTVVDQVGMSTGSAYKEGTPLTSLTTNVDRGYERKPGGASGSGQDTDDNSADFALVTPNNPQNKLSTCVSTGSTNPSGVGAASPSTVTAGGSTLLTVTVTPGTGPASTGLAVSGDLTSIGGSATQQFFDDATNGDVTAGDNVFSFSAAVPLATTPGAKTLPATITDAQARSGSASIALTVTAPSTVGPGDVVVSEVYGGGGNSGATFKNDFIELYNRTGSAIDLAGWSVQYASAAGTSWQTTALSGTIAPGGYYLVQEGAGAGGDLPLPGPGRHRRNRHGGHRGQGRAGLEHDRALRRVSDGRSDHRLRRLRHHGELLRGRRAGARAVEHDVRLARERRRDGHEQQLDRLHRRRTQSARHDRSGADGGLDDAGQRHVGRRHELERHDQLLRAGEPDRHRGSRSPARTAARTRPRSRRTPAATSSRSTRTRTSRRSSRAP